jgi:phosphoribosyl-AMP cyclohydrolase / phosphoribosyl-ATP pyrophosphohydrolase
MGKKDRSGGSGRSGSPDNPEIQPLILRKSDGTIIDLVQCNEKGFLKSLEQKELWVLHPDTGKLLPYRDGKVGFSSLARGKGWYEAVLEAEGAAEERTADEAGPTRETELAGAAELAAQAPGGEAAADTGQSTKADGTAAVASAGAAAGARGEGMVESLEALIRQRREEMPEGSYTTHLFSKGRGKIRKKLGEEAVELLLAENREELIFEASDLLYHLLVMLAFEDVRFRELEEELQRRHTPENKTEQE